MFTRALVFVTLLATSIAAPAGPNGGPGSHIAASVTTQAAVVMSAAEPTVVQKARASILATFQLEASGKVRVTAASNAKRIRLNYHSAKEKRYAVTVTVHQGAAVKILPKGSTLIFARTLATSKLRESPKVHVQPVDPMHTLTLDSGWDGVAPGQDIHSAAQRLDIETWPLKCPPVVRLTTQTNWPNIVATDGTTIDFLEVWDNSKSLLGADEGMNTILGPDGIRVGQPVSRYTSLTSSSRVVERFPGDTKFEWDAWWVLRAEHGWYFWIRSDITSHKVVSYGLALTRHWAYDRAHTQGGCF